MVASYRDGCWGSLGGGGVGGGRWGRWGVLRIRESL